MSKRLLSFFLSELKTVRLICKHEGCGVVQEMTPEQLGRRFSAREVECPHCRENFGVHIGQAGNPFVQLAFLASQASQPNAKFEVEFVIPDQSAG